MKRNISFIVLLIILFSLLITPMAVYADEVNLDKVQPLVDKANKDIEREIQKAQKDVEKYVDKSFDDKISERIDDLINVTNEISNKTVEKAEKYDIKVECEFIEVIIGDKPVFIDPLRIVGV